MSVQHRTTPFSRAWKRFGRALRGQYELSRLDDRMLQDLGVSRAQASFLAERRHVWHAAPIAGIDDLGQPMI